MLDQMIESKDTLKESKTLFYLFSFFTVLALASVVGVGIWHLGNLLGYYQQGGMSGDLELTSLVAPVPVQPDEPPPVEETPKKEQEKNLPNVDTRTEIIQRVDESPQIPDKISTEKVNIPPRDPNKLTLKGNENKSFETSVPSDYRGDVNPNSQQENKCQGIDCGDGKNELDGTDKEVAVVKKPDPTPKPVPKVVSGGVVNGKARNLVTPQYPSAARAVRASGPVNVQVTIDEQGNVISASATSGHTLLRAAAVQAARSSKFNPTLLTGQPVKVTGIIIYNFVAP